MVLSTLSSTSIEDVAEALSGGPSGGVYWLQLYIFKDRDMSIRLIRRAELVGFSGIVLTIDAPGGLVRAEQLHARVSRARKAQLNRTGWY